MGPVSGPTDSFLGDRHLLLGLPQLAFEPGDLLVARVAIAGEGAGPFVADLAPPAVDWTGTGPRLALMPRSRAAREALPRSSERRTASRLYSGVNERHVRDMDTGVLG